MFLITIYKKYIILRKQSSFALSRAHVTTSDCCTLSHLHRFSTPDSSEVCRLSSPLVSVGSCCKSSQLPNSKSPSLAVSLWGESKRCALLKWVVRRQKDYVVRRGSIGQGHISGILIQPRLCWMERKEIICQCFHKSHVLFFSHALKKNKLFQTTEARSVLPFFLFVFLCLASSWNWVTVWRICCQFARLSSSSFLCSRIPILHLFTQATTDAPALGKTQA